MENNGVPVILASERLLFRRHVIADMDAYCAMEQDVEVRKFVGGYPRRREDAEERFLKGMQQPVTEMLSMWATVLKSENKYIGRCGVYPHFGDSSFPIEGEGAIAFYLAHAYWDKGFATEAGKAFIRFGFDELNLKRIVTTIQAGNAASINVIEKLGFTLTYIEPPTETNPRSFHHFELKSI